MNNYEKKDLQIGYFNSLNAAVQLIPEDKKGTKEGFELAHKYHRDLFKRFVKWHTNNIK